MQDAPAIRACDGQARSSAAIAAHMQQLQNFISLEQFQIALPPEKIGIIVHANRHYPVVPANTQK
jgi:hypothetical protein